MESHMSSDYDFVRLTASSRNLRQESFSEPCEEVEAGADPRHAKDALDEIVTDSTGYASRFSSTRENSSYFSEQDREDILRREMLNRDATELKQTIDRYWYEKQMQEKKSKKKF